MYNVAMHTVIQYTLTQTALLIKISKIYLKTSHSPVTMPLLGTQCRVRRGHRHPTQRMRHSSGSVFFLLNGLPSPGAAPVSAVSSPLAMPGNWWPPLRGSCTPVTHASKHSKAKAVAQGKRTRPVMKVKYFLLSDTPSFSKWPYLRVRSHD